MKKLIIGAIALLCCVNGANAVKAEAEILYTVIMGGQCQKLMVFGEDLTSICKDKFLNKLWNNGREIYLISTDIENIIILLSGGKSQQPRLDRYTLFLDTVRIGVEGDIYEQRIVGTCEMYGDVDKEKTLHKCVAQDNDGGEIIFEFQSVPNQIELIN